MSVKKAVYTSSTFGAGSALPVNNHFKRERNMAFRFSKTWGARILAVWLILTGVVPLIKLNFVGSSEIMAALAIAAGVLLLLDR